MIVFESLSQLASRDVLFKCDRLPEIYMRRMPKRLPQPSTTSTTVYLVPESDANVAVSRVTAARQAIAAMSALDRWLQLRRRRR